MINNINAEDWNKLDACLGDVKIVQELFGNTTQPEDKMLYEIYNRGHMKTAVWYICRLLNHKDNLRYALYFLKKFEGKDVYEIIRFMVDSFERFFKSPMNNTNRYKLEKYYLMWSGALKGIPKSNVQSILVDAMFNLSIISYSDYKYYSSYPVITNLIDLTEEPYIIFDNTFKVRREVVQYGIKLLKKSEK